MFEHPTKGKCLIYARVSTQSETQSNSLAFQILDDDVSMFEDFKIKYTYDTYAIYSDDTSGTTDNRKGYQDMLYFLGIERKEVNTNRNLPTGNIKIKKHYVYDVNEDTVRYVRDVLGINYILCKNTSRWTRSGDFDLIEMLRNNRIYIYFKDENIDTFNSDSDTLLGIIQKLDRSKSTDTSKKMKSGMETSIKLGRIRTNTFIYGFEVVQQENNMSSLLVPIPEEAEVVKLIYKLYTEENMGARQIVNKLSEMGITTRPKETKKGKAIGGIPFGVSSIKRILQNEKYCGYINIEKRWETGEVFNHISPKRLYDYKIKPCEYITPIVSYETFIKAQEICKQRSDKTSQRGRNTGNSIYHHKIKCAVCGAWFAQNGEKNAQGEYIKKMNCGNKKRHGLKYCDSENISFTEIEKEYTYLAENFSKFLIHETRRHTTNFLYILLSLFDGYFHSDEDTIENIKNDMQKFDDICGELILQRSGLGPMGQLKINEMIENAARSSYECKMKLEQIAKYKESFVPLINKVFENLRILQKIDINRCYTIAEIKNFDIILFVGKCERRFELQMDSYYDFFDALDYLTDDIQIYMEQSIETLNDSLEQFYDAYGCSERYYFNRVNVS